MSKHYSYTSPDDPEPLICDQCAVYAEKADYWLAAKERTDSYLDAEMARRRAAEDERDALRADRDALAEPVSDEPDEAGLYHNRIHQELPNARPAYAVRAADGFRAEAEALRRTLRNVYGHVTNGNLEWPDALQLIEETCCTAMSDAERTLALCEYGEATE